ncbi:hypothetical protein B0T25DRAFT_567871 [Lasiosphaeria hispida]|uniref:Mid2 domain-containing protein n=1 Tax=Lasiosphaeria hispida TaxID=260671 RepID=A0AAJ0HH78_9PEZI|nr:hypothetical protein B0T25DRAFT_567871 [Lasiosphaeria hispida]
MPSVYRFQRCLSLLLLSFWVARLQHWHVEASPVPSAIISDRNHVEERGLLTHFDPAHDDILLLRSGTTPTSVSRNEGIQKRQAVVSGPYSTVSAGPGGASVGSGPGTGDANDPGEDVGGNEEGLTADQKIAIAVPIAAAVIAALGGYSTWYFGKCCFFSRAVRGNEPEVAEAGGSLDGAKPELDSITPSDTGQPGDTGGEQDRMNGMHGGVPELPATGRPSNTAGGEQRRMNEVHRGATELPTWGGDRRLVELE